MEDDDFLQTIATKRWIMKSLMEVVDGFHPSTDERWQLIANIGVVNMSYYITDELVRLIFYQLRGS